MKYFNIDVCRFDFFSMKPELQREYVETANARIDVLSKQFKVNRQVALGLALAWANLTVEDAQNKNEAKRQGAIPVDMHDDVGLEERGEFYVTLLRIAQNDDMALIQRPQL